MIIINNKLNKEIDEIDFSNVEYSSMSNFYSTSYHLEMQDVKLQDLYTLLRNPYNNMKRIRDTSRYMSNKYGIIRDILRTMRSLPNLNYHLAWSSYDDIELIKENEKIVYDFLDEINVKKACRDSIYEVCEIGTIVMCNRNNKYIQFLDLDELKIDKQRNGKWIVEYDLECISNGSQNIKEIQNKINSLPKEITLRKYNLYKSKGEDYRYVELSDCEVINIDSIRNNPYGLPFSFSAWSSILQKDLISKAERSVIDRMIKQILILQVENLNKGTSNEKPPPKEVIDMYFNELSRVVLSKEKGRKTATVDESGVGLATLPYFLKLDSLDVDTNFIPKEMYEKVNDDIYDNLGVSQALISGKGSNYSSSQVNIEKIFKYIFSILEDFESVINTYIKKLIPNNLRCKFYFERTSSLDRNKYISSYKDLYMQTGNIIPWIESITGQPYHYTVSMKHYQDKVLRTKDLFQPAANAFTQSGKDKNVGRPTSENDDNANTNKSKSNGSNDVPKPSS